MSLSNRVALAVADPFENVREFDALVNRLFNGNPVAAGVSAPYAVDIREDADHFYIEAELPGYTKEEVDITMENSTLAITAEKKAETKDENPQNPGYLLQERRWNRFQRSFKLPLTVDGSSVQASLTDGILRIQLNKREDTKPRKIKVS